MSTHTDIAPAPARAHGRATRRGVLFEHRYLFALTAAWTFAPIVRLLLHVWRHGGELTGAFGYDPYDQLAYLAWIRDAGAHWLSSNLWQLHPTPHDYLQPMFFLSGLAVRLGASVQLAYLLWTPVALVVMFCGFGFYARDFFPAGRRAQAAVLALALFYESPVLSVWKWTGHLTSSQLFALLEPSDDPNSALNLWGFAHTAIAIGLMPVFLLAIVRLRALDGVQARRAGAVAALAGALVSWLHPWQGVMLVAAALALPLASRSWSRWRALLAVAAVTAQPLIYGDVLAHADASWREFQRYTTLGAPPPAWALLAALGPLAVVALAGLRRPSGDGEWLLVLWVVGCAGVYLLVPEFPPHALSGITLPLAVLAVRGWQRVRGWLRVREGANAWALAGLAALLAVTVPAAVRHADDVRTLFSDPSGARLQILDPDESRALAFIAAQPGAGVLADPDLAMVVPGLTGHPAYAGHLMWRPLDQLASAQTFFAAATAGAQRRAILRASGARFVLADCGDPARLVVELAPDAVAVRHFGCVTVYERVT